MAGTITLEANQWRLIKERLNQDYPRSYTALSYVTRRELGFTPRHHKGLVPYLDKYGRGILKEVNATDEVERNFIEKNKHKFVYDDQVHLDFYNEAAMSWFVLKYLNNYHTATFWGIIIAIVSSPILGWISFGE